MALQIAGTDTCLLVNDMTLKSTTDDFRESRVVHDVTNVNEVEYVPCHKRSYPSICDDQTNEPTLSVTRKDTQFAVTESSFAVNKRIEPHTITLQQVHNKNGKSETVSPYPSNEDKNNDDDSVASMSKSDCVLPPECINVQNNMSPGTSHETTVAVDRNYADIYYEHLQGGLVLIYIFHRGSIKQPAFIMQGVYASNSQIEPFCSDAQIAAITFSSKPNSNQSKTYYPFNKSIKFEHLGFVMKKVCGLSKKETNQFVITKLQELATFLNTHCYTTRYKLTKEHSSVQYSLASSPDLTPPKVINKLHKRKLGDLIVMNHAINYVYKLDYEITSEIYQMCPQLISKYFNPPYADDLKKSFGFP